jgi:REP element-mobilizing transposase RayT
MDFYRHRLPHVRARGAVYFVTWRLKAGLADLSDEERDLVCASLCHFDSQRYALRAYVVMNDHVRVMGEPNLDFHLEAILHSWKSFSSKRIGQIRGQAGTIWQDEYFDRVIRNESEYREKRDYILDNPFRRWLALETYRWCWAIGMEQI